MHGSGLTSFLWHLPTWKSPLHTQTSWISLLLFWIEFDERAPLHVSNNGLLLRYEDVRPLALRAVKRPCVVYMPGLASFLWHLSTWMSPLYTKTSWMSDGSFVIEFSKWWAPLRDSNDVLPAKVGHPDHCLWGRSKGWMYKWVRSGKLLLATTNLKVTTQYPTIRNQFLFYLW